jgi:type I restriction enzyme, S subunit
MSREPVACLGQVLDVASGQVDPREAPFCDYPHVGGDNIESGTGVLAGLRPARELGLISGKYVFGPDDVLYSKIRPALNKVALPDFVGICSADMYPLRPRVGVLDRRYLAHLLRRDHFLVFAEKHSSRTNIPKINREALLAYEFRLPSLAEQRRVADILDKVDAVRRKRKEAIALTEELLRSAFLEMFGDPVTNPKGWPARTIGEILDIATGGTPSRSNSSNFGGGIPWVKTTEVRDSVIMTTEESISEQGLRGSNCRVFPKKTILVAMYGQGSTRGRTAMLGIEATTNQACAAILPSPKVAPIYLWTFLRMSYERLRDLGRGGNQPNLNLSMVRSFPMPLPPTETQGRFVKVGRQIGDLRAAQERYRTEAEALFSSLVHRAFRGEHGSDARKKSGQTHLDLFGKEQRNGST